MRPFEVVFYVREDGSQHAREFIQSLDGKMRAKISRDIELLSSRGPKLREPYSKPLRNGIFELRSKVSTDISRVLYFFVIGGKIVLTNGFIKKTPQTPPSEIERAERYRADYYRRKERGE